jgi:hypothetical protein
VDQLDKDVTVSDQPDGSSVPADPPTAEADTTVKTVDAVEVVDESDVQAQSDTITEPGKLLRIALMLREMQEEVRRADPDEAGRQRLRQIHETSLAQMRSVLTGSLQEELDALTLPFDTETPTESEIRIAQAQLIGWLEGLFQGIQAAIASQQMSARQQLEQMRRQLPPGMQRGGPTGPSAAHEERQPGGTGQYL